MGDATGQLQAILDRHSEIEAREKPQKNDPALALRQQLVKHQGDGVFCNFPLAVFEVRLARYTLILLSCDVLPHERTRGDPTLHGARLVSVSCRRSALSQDYHPGNILGCALTPEGQLLTCSADKSLRIGRVEGLPGAAHLTPEAEVISVARNAPVLCTAVNPQRTLAVSGGEPLV